MRITVPPTLFCNYFTWRIQQFGLWGIENTTTKEFWFQLLISLTACKLYVPLAFTCNNYWSVKYHNFPEISSHPKKNVLTCDMTNRAYKHSIKHILIHDKYSKIFRRLGRNLFNGKVVKTSCLHEFSQKNARKSSKNYLTGCSLLSCFKHDF